MCSLGPGHMNTLIIKGLVLGDVVNWGGGLYLL